MTSEISLTTETPPGLTEPNADGGLKLLTNGENSSEEELLLHRRERAYKLRVVERKSYADIARELGVSRASIVQDCKVIAKQRADALVEEDKELVAEQDEIYRQLLNKWLPVATQENSMTEIDGVMCVDQRPLIATDKVIKILSEQAKLHALGAGSKTLTPKSVGEAAGDHVLRVMQQLAEGRFSRNAVKGEIIDVPELDNGQKIS